MSDLTERVGMAIETASKIRAFGLYDYSNYKGSAPPHVVRNERTGERIMTSWSADAARAKYEQCCREFIAQAAIEAMQGQLNTINRPGVE